MNPSGGPIASYRRYWLPELAALLALALATAVLFAVTGLDISAARRFYHPGLPDPWPVAKVPLWHLFYRSAPYVTGSLSIVGVAVLVAGVIRKESRRYRVYGAFILLCIILGPGLIINGILKDHWGRPRPRQIVEFGGRLPYVSPLVPSGAHGKSFPCGHCSVGYLYGIGWWVGRRRHPRWGGVSLAAGLAAGTLLGIGRMAAGGHFLSDVVWSGWIAFLVAHVLYYYVLRIPAREDSLASLFPMLERSPRRKTAVIAISILLGAGIIGGGIVATPHDRDLAARIRLSEFPAAPETIEVVVDTLTVELFLSAEPPPEVECTGYIHGFGLPTNDIRVRWEYLERPVPTLRYRVSQKGWFPDIDGVARIRIPVRNLRRIIVRLDSGNIVVADNTVGGLPGDLVPILDLHTRNGRVLQPYPGRIP